MHIIPVVQNIDRNVSARDYKNQTKIVVTSMFSTLQGEGPYTGYPAMFLRLSGCNYGSKNEFCAFCDTSFQLDAGTAYEPLQLLNTLLTTEGYHRNQILVITGGEPTLQINLLSLIVLATSHFADIQLETNGTQPKFYNEAIVRNASNLFKSVVSPKPNTRLGKYPLVSPKVMWWASCLKFVISAEKGVHHTIPDWALDTKKPIYVSPMAVYIKEYKGEVSSIWEDGLIDKEQTAANYRYAAQYAMNNNLRLSLQTHLFTSIP